MTFASLMYTRPELPPGRGPITVRVSGQIRHCISSIHLSPPQNSGEAARRSWSQVYYLGLQEAENERRLNPRYNNLRHALLRGLDEEIRECNHIAQVYMSLSNAEQEEIRQAQAEGRECEHVSISIHTSARDDQRRYNQPSSIEGVAAVFRSTDGLPPPDTRYVARLIIPQHGHFFKTIDPNHPIPNHHPGI